MSDDEEFGEYGRNPGLRPGGLILLLAVIMATTVPLLVGLGILILTGIGAC